MSITGLSSLEPDETNCRTATSAPLKPHPNKWDYDFEHLPRALSGPGNLRHRSWWHDHQRVYRALEDLNPHGHRPVRFGMCGVKVHVEVSNHDPPEYRLAGETCRDRWCRPCQRERGRIVAANIVEHLGTAPCRFVTLTIRTENLSLRDAVQKLYTSFSRLRQTVFWRSRVTGGCATCEIKRTRDGLRWHPHLHLLVQGKYIPQGWLGRKWHAITGDSYIVDIFMCDNGLEAARYVTKYLSKPVPSSILRNPEHLREAIKALDGRHMVATFGDWRGKKLTETVSENTWATLCTYHELVRGAMDGDLESHRILRGLLAQHNLNPNHLEDWVREHNAVHRDLQLTLELS